MKLKKLFGLLALFLVGLPIAFALTACGDEKDDEPCDCLTGYWYAEWDDEFEALNLADNGQGESMCAYIGVPSSIEKDYFPWDEEIIGYDLKVISVNSNVLVVEEGDGGEKIVYNRISAEQWNNLKKTASLDGTLSSDPDDDEWENPMPEYDMSIIGTDWEGVIDGDYVELSFKYDGTFTEIYAGDKSTSVYKQLDYETILIGEGTVMYNTFGGNPFHFEMSKDKSSIVFYNDYDTWKFSRKS